MGLEALAGMKIRPPRGFGGWLASKKRKWFSTSIQVVGPAGAGVTSFIIQLVQQGIIGENVSKNYNFGKGFTTLLQAQGVVRKLNLRDVPVEKEEERFMAFCADYLKRKPAGVVWVAPGLPEILNMEEPPEYELFRKYVQFLMSTTYPLPGDGGRKKKVPKFLAVYVNHMDEYERMWSVNFLDYLHHYREPLNYVRKNHRSVKVICQPCCAWAGINVREPLMQLLMDVEVEKVKV